jgi:D-alanyl-D-alanine carboxypeptidase
MPAIRRIRRSVWSASLYLATALLALVLAAVPARAQVGSDRYSSIVIDAATDTVLSSVNADEPRYPASLTKMMTLYMVFEALRDRRITLNQYVPVSSHAASMSPSKLGLVPSTRITVQQAILGIVTRSANDAAAALGEMLGGSEDRFGQMMTLRARALGMSHCTFHNASGLPDPDQVVTARDLATLARHLIRDFPGEYHWFSTPSFAWHGNTIFNHDNMLKSYPGADGLKTGYTEAAGHNLVTSAVRGDVRLVGVVLGAGSNGERDVHMTALLNQGFERLDVPGIPHVSRVSNIVAAANAAPAPHRVQPAHWSIQVGAFATETAARQAASQARRAAEDGDVRIEPATVHGHTSWRALLTGFSQPEAHQACAMLARHKMPCTPIRPEARQLASR